MGQNISVKAIVLRVQQVGESDRLCTLLTDIYGVIKAYARGAQNIKNKNFAATNQFVYGTFQLFHSKDRYMIDETDYDELHIAIRDNIDNLALAQYLCEYTSEVAPKEADGSCYLWLLRNALHLMAATDRPHGIIKAAMEMRMLAIAGYMPDLVMCEGCGVYEADEMYFMSRSGIIRCSECGPSENCYVKMSRGALAAMRHSMYVDLRKTYSFTLSDDSLSQLCDAAEAYIRENLGLSFKTLEFYKSLQPKQ